MKGTSGDAGGSGIAPAGGIGVPMRHRGDLNNRLLALQLLPVEGRRSQQEFASSSGVARKTPRHDIDALSACHPVVEAREGRQVCYRYREDFQLRCDVYRQLVGSTRCGSKRGEVS